jgi:CRISPR-associated protein Cas1
MDIYLQASGSRLRVRDGIFEVTVPDRTGSNRHLAESFPAHEVNSIMLQPGASVSSDALLLALAKDTDVFILDKFGDIHGRFLSNRPNSTLEIWKNQLRMSTSPDGLDLAKKWVELKVMEQLAHLSDLKKYRDLDKVAVINQAQQQINELLLKMRKINAHAHPDTAAASIRGYEGSISSVYFHTLSFLLPPEYQFGSKDKQPVSDLFYAFLFYGYGILYRLVEKALLMAGVHPYIGFMHRDGYQRKSMVFDFIEPYRIWVDRVVFKMFSGKRVSMQFAIEEPQSGLRLNEDARRLIRDSLQQLMKDQKKAIKNRSFPLELFLREQAIEFAALLRSPLPPKNS